MTTAPNFVSFDTTSNKFTFTPYQPAHLGTFTITGTIDDLVVAVPYSFSITVLDIPPVMASNPVDQTIYISEIFVYTLP